jgi:hypothetical protein
MPNKPRQPPTTPPGDQPPQLTAATPEQATTESSATAPKLPTRASLEALGIRVQRASGKSYTLLAATGYQKAKKATEETQE